MTDEQIFAMQADMAAGSKGPFRVGPVDDCRVEDALGNEVAQIDGDYNQPETWPIMEANARRIASVPDMEAEILRLRNFIADFAEMTFETISGRAHDPQDDLPDVTEIDAVFAWQEDARALLKGGA